MDYNASHATMCYAQVHVAFVSRGWKAIKQNRKKWVSDDIKAVGSTW